MSDLDILNPVVDVQVGRKTVQVRELAWPQALKLCRLLADHVTKFVDADGRPIRATGDILARLVLSIEEVGPFLIANATDLTPEEIQRLPASGAIGIISAAITLTLNEEVITMGKQVAERLGAVTQESPGSSIFSSGKATTGPTSNATPSGNSNCSVQPQAGG